MVYDLWDDDGFWSSRYPEVYGGLPRHPFALPLADGQDPAELYGYSRNSGTLGGVAPPGHAATASYLPYTSHDRVENDTHFSGGVGPPDNALPFDQRGMHSYPPVTYYTPGEQNTLSDVNLAGANFSDRAGDGSYLSPHGQNLDMQTFSRDTTPNGHLEGTNNFSHTGMNFDILGEWNSDVNAPSTGHLEASDNSSYPNMDFDILGEWNSDYDAPSTGHLEASDNSGYPNMNFDILGEWNSDYNAPSTSHPEASNNSGYANLGSYMPPSNYQAYPEQTIADGTSSYNESQSYAYSQQVTPASMNAITQPSNARNGAPPPPRPYTRLQDRQLCPHCGGPLTPEIIRQLMIAAGEEAPVEAKKR